MNKERQGKDISSMPDGIETSSIGASIQSVPHNQPAVEPAKIKPFSVWRFLVITIGGIFLAEVIAMIVIVPLQNLPYYLQTLIDAGIMVVMIFPLVYYFSLRPLLNHIEMQEKAEHALRQSEERFAVAFHSSPAASSISRVSDGTFIDVNESFLHLFGYDRTEVVGHTSIELEMYPEPKIRREFMEELETHGGTRDSEMMFRTKSGEIRTINLSAEPITLGDEACILATMSDVTERKREEELVRTERQRFYDVLETLPAYLVLLTPDYHVPFANRFFRERFGESHGRRCYEHLFGRSEPCEICETYKVISTHARGTWEWTGPHGRIYDVSDYPFTDTDGSPLILEMGIDVTERKQAEARLRRVNHALSVLNECNQLLVHAENESELLQKMCEIIVNVGEYRMAWVGFAEQDEARSVRPMAQFGFEDGYLGLANITWADDEYGRGPTGTAIREGVTQVNQNFLINPNMEPWRESALLRGFQSSIALPLQDESSTFGALTIYSASPDAFDNEEVHLLEELGNDLAFGITALRARAERKKADELIRRLSSIVEQTKDTVVVTNCDGAIEYVNPAFEQLTGYTKEEMLGKTSRVLKSGLHGIHFYRELWATILGGEAFQGEIANRRKNGELFYEVKTITPMRNSQGLITHFVATGKDITEHKLDEVKLRQAYDELEQRVQERTEELRIANSELEDEIHIRRRAEATAQQYVEELRVVNQELTRFNKAMIGRELRMMELKKEVNQLCESAGHSPRYSLDFEKE